MQRVGSMLTLFFHRGPVRSWADAAESDRVVERDDVVEPDSVTGPDDATVPDGTVPASVLDADEGVTEALDQGFAQFGHQCLR